jgi:short-subunit dehydrogenase
MTASAKTLLITGATGAIGGALALGYARPGVCLILQGRDRARLQALATACEQRGSSVSTAALDLRDTAALRAWVAATEARAPIDLVIASAGVCSHSDPSGNERWDEVDALLEINLRSVLVLVDAVLPAMQARRAGQIVLVSSLAAWFGLPLAPTYCASKAAIKVYGEALRSNQARHGIRVNVVMPGDVESAMLARWPAPRTFLLQPAQAAQAIARGIARNQARISFPFPLNFGAWWLAVLPAPVAAWIVKKLGYGG